MYGNKSKGDEYCGSGVKREIAGARRLICENGNAFSFNQIAVGGYEG
jgi:hypothetical protein